MLDAPDRCSRIHGRTALHSQRINLSANHAVFQDHVARPEPSPRFVSRPPSIDNEISQSRFCSVTSFPRGLPRSSFAISIASLYTETEGVSYIAERTLCAPHPPILFSRGMFFAVSAASLRAHDLRPAVCGRFNNNSCPICLFRTRAVTRLFMLRTIARVW